MDRNIVEELIAQGENSSIEFKSDNVRPDALKFYQTIDGKCWIRVGSTNRTATKEELSRLFQEAGLVHFDIAPVERTNRASLDTSKLHQYFETYYQIDYVNLDEKEQHQILSNNEYVEYLNS